MHFLILLWLYVSSEQKEMDKTKGQRDYEEKLIVSAWYNMVRKISATWNRHTSDGYQQVWLECFFYIVAWTNAQLRFES